MVVVTSNQIEAARCSNGGHEHVARSSTDSHKNPQQAVTSRLPEAEMAVKTIQIQFARD